ncbi:2-(1,2-epoxy-1,2-dihydrophenyl)acetyl-CoA isomerase [Jatrophihabitans sp. GAS493]|uniref:enoyl-CoA hydratase n=1 Tax=Jatrophihabitans sp. GAS493 TaxID=1907575 RepID=UPI000BB7D392|nr:enoyl-CoA hydratase [Jatrophihabitans sp. GAS493]SOD72123.1 2-(1,2-epoxy-1,2-dihydrophenyl)acetyl-CoA isomerase [Jatrophihabitans sp. GAS493]
MSVTLARADGIARITIDNPGRRNALTPADFATLRDLLGEVADTPGDRVLIVAGAGGTFCAGADLSDGPPESSVIAAMRPIHETARALHRLPQPVIAAVEGHAVGAGMSLALGCDIVLASTSAKFSQIFVKRGLSPDFGSSWLLPRLVGVHMAKRLALLGDIIDAQEALRLGIVAEVSEPDDFQQTVDRWAGRLAEGPPMAMAFTKQLIDQSFSTSFDDALDAEAAVAAVNSVSEDATEAFKAFAEKRTPTFKGR